MKLIDLFVKIANREKVPNIIKFHGKIFTTNGEEYNYYCEEKEKLLEDFFIFEELNDEVEIIEDKPKCDLPPYTDWHQQQIDFENKILLSKLESDTKLDIIKKYITSEEAINNFKSIENRDEWLKVHDKILDIIDNFKLQNESGEIIEDTSKEDKKIEKYYDFLDTSSNDMKSLRSRVNELTDTLNEIIDKINGDE